MRTYSPKRTDVERAWYVIDADGLVLGRLATEAARLLQGKHKPIYAPNTDVGDHVVVVNAAKVVMTANKATEKLAYSHSGYPGGLKVRRFADLLSDRPDETVRRSVKGMLPKSRLGRQMARKLRVYAGPTHPHAAQSPKPIALEAARRQR